MAGKLAFFLTTLIVVLVSMTHAARISTEQLVNLKQDVDESSNQTHAEEDKTQDMVGISNQTHAEEDMSSKGVSSDDLLEEEEETVDTSEEEEEAKGCHYCTG